MRQLHGIYTQRFVDNPRRMLPRDRDFSEVSRTQRRPLPNPLHHHAEMHPDKNEAIAAADESGGYTLQAIGEHVARQCARMGSDQPDRQGM